MPSTTTFSPQPAITPDDSLVSDRFPGWLLGLFLVVMTLVAYEPVWHAGFVWDDDTLLTGNAAVKSPDGLSRIWFQTDFPLTVTSFWLEWRLWGMYAPGYHLTNILLHAAGALLFWRVLARLKIPAAWLAAACFAVHPVNVESVAWIAERKNTLALVFFTLTLLVYLRFEDTGRWRWYWAALGAFTLALFSKTAVAPLPLVLLGIAWWRRGRVRPLDVWRSLPFFAIAALLSLMSVWFQNQVGSGGVRLESFWSRLAGAGWVAWFYLYKAFLPLNLIFVYPRWQINAASFWSYLPVLLLAAAIAIGWRYRNRWSKGWLFGLSYFIVMLLPVLGFVNVYFMRYSLIADHYQYFAIIGPLAAGVGGLVWLGNRFSKETHRFLPVAGGMILLTLGVQTWRQCRMYSNTDTLWQVTLQQNPRCDMAYNNLGADFLAQGRVDEAIVYYQKSLDLMPDDVSHGNLGYALLKKGRWDEAIDHLEAALKIRPDFPEADFNLGVALEKKGRTDDAIEHFQTAAKSLPNDPEVQKALAHALMRQGQLEPAIEHYQKALALRPGEAGAHQSLGNALFRKGQVDEAVAHYRKALDLDPAAIPVHNSLGLALMQQGHVDEAMAEYQKVLERQPGNTDALGNLADALLAKRQPDEAIVLYRKILEIAPANTDVLGNLGNAFLLKGQTDDAIACFQQVLTAQPENANARVNLGNALVREHHLPEAITQYRRVLDKDPDNIPALYRLSRILATSSDPTFRNGPWAVQLMEHANHLSNDRDPVTLAMLAGAYAEIGKFPDAIAAVQRAIALAAQNNPALAKNLESQLALYQDESPFHDPSLTNAPSTLPHP
jgi:tetratricopeptide (TPR) repeat protein